MRRGGVEEAEAYAYERLMAKAIPVRGERLTLSLPSVEVSSLTGFLHLASMKDLIVYHDKKNLQFITLYNHVVHTVHYASSIRDEGSGGLDGWAVAKR
ncbi:MAG: hypothetical protein QXR65_09080 [Candidatus Bathyarchaeia archaeon]|nr:hypothetical protein [Candidatus Bathyarchaeota archaeon]